MSKKDERIGIRVTAYDKRRWERQSYMDDMSLASWITWLANSYLAMQELYNQAPSKGDINNEATK